MMEAATALLWALVVVVALPVVAALGITIIALYMMWKD